MYMVYCIVGIIDGIQIDKLVKNCTVKLETLVLLNFGKTFKDERNVDKMVVKALIIVL